MLELGENQNEIHRDAGREIAGRKIDLLVGVRGLAKELVEGANAAGLDNTVFLESSDLAGEFVADEVKPGDVVLIKGSRGVRTEKVVEKLLERFELEERDAAKR
jgi:UDP-N-acetylmuramoyl-tripeptide--D-alanyl-D-alanine ligase